MKKTILFFLLGLSATVFAQQNTSAAFKQKAFTLVRFLQKKHFQPIEWNDATSGLLYDKWLEKLDEEKLFLTASDISQLTVYKPKLDDELLGKDWRFFDLSVNLYSRRLQQADSMIQLFTAKPFDFSKPDDFKWPYNEYAANEQEIGQRWLRFLKWRTLDEISDKLLGKNKRLDKAIPAEFAQMELAARQKIKKQELTYIKNLKGTPESFLAGMQNSYLETISWCYDPHTEYMSIAAKKEFETEMSAAEFSVGFDYEENDKGDKVISYLQPGGSAWRSGKLHTGDVLQKIKINNVETDIESISKDELDKLLGSASNQELELTVKTSAGEQNTVKLTKEKITDEESVVKSYVLRGKKNIAYINLPGFYSREDEATDENAAASYQGCANDVSKEIVKLKKDTIQGLILDLRFNGGGSMWEAMQLAGIFIDIGPVASVKDRDGKVHFLKDPNRGTIYDGPMIVLINGASASASEFLSAALQDYNRALIVGGTTYGKGSAQLILPMDTALTFSNNNYTDFVKVTEEKFYRVNGSTVQWKGVVPDITLPDVYADDAFREKANKSALQPDNSKTGMYEALKALPVQSLAAASSQRLAADPYFKAIASFNTWMSQRRKSLQVPLQWPAFAENINKTLEMFQSLRDEDDGKMVTGLHVTNNSFDAEGIRQSTERSNQINNVYLRHIQADKVIDEAYKIMMDWIN